ncbi:Tetratricopeptide repeat protein 30A, partial [Goodea atripinnis]
AFRKFEEMNSKLTEQLRKLAKQVQDTRHIRDDEVQSKTLQDYDLMQEKYIVVLMAQAKIYWNRENFQMVEKIFRKSVEFCNDDDTWKLNVAHVLFMQNKYKEAISFYEPIVKKHYDSFSLCCAAYQAEELMRKIEKEEEQISYDDPDKKVFHLCIVNLVIGSLGTDTWFYAKRCFLSLLENMSKHMVMLRDAVVQECVQFLEHCEVYGKEVPAIIEQPLEEIHGHIGKNTVTYEARLLKALFYEVIGWNK